MKCLPEETQGCQKHVVCFSQALRQALGPSLCGRGDSYPGVTPVCKPRWVSQGPTRPSCFLAFSPSLAIHSWLPLKSLVTSVYTAAEFSSCWALFPIAIAFYYLKSVSQLCLSLTLPKATWPGTEPQNADFLGPQYRAQGKRAQSPAQALTHRLLPAPPGGCDSDSYND